MEVFKSPYDFSSTLSRIEKSVTENHMVIVNKIDAGERMRKAGFKVGGNYIFEVFRPDLAYRVISTQIRAGIEPPLRIYVYEDGGEVYVEYRDPAEVFEKWGLGEMGKELDELFRKIVLDALKKESLSS
ncbi:hypothetical protein HS7_11730 [Sulfolobales archaeon HS-7]|nr:hypothetical protein HS7_11730 [Sulfolobales archaeon HS-7]